MQPTRPATATIATALAVFLLANLAVAALANRAMLDDWGSEAVNLKLQLVRRFAQQHPQADVVFTGDSTVGRGINPASVASRLGDAVVFNAEVRGSGPAFWNLWVRDIVVPELQPRVVVIGTEAGGFAEGWFDLASYYEDSPARLEYLEAYPKPVQAIRRIIPLVRYRSILSDPGRVMRAVLESPSLSGYDPLGWRPLNGDFRVPDGWTERYASLSFADMTRQQSALQELVRYLKSSGVTPVLLEMPELKELRPLNMPDPDSNFVLYEEALRKIAADEGIALWDANALPWTLDDYADPHHLNRRGAEKLSVWVADQLRQHPALLAGR